MNIDIIPKQTKLSLIESEEIKYTLFSLIKPLDRIGYTTIFEKPEGELVPLELKNTTCKTLKQQKFRVVHFVKNEKINIEFLFHLYSDLMELLMETNLKCQVEITNFPFIIQNKSIDLIEDFTHLIQEQINTIINLQTNNDTISQINNLIQILPMQIKELFHDYAKLINCRLADTKITDKAKKQTKKETIYNAMQKNDLYELAENKELTMEMLKINEELLDHRNRLKKKSSVDELEIENESYRLIIERFEQLKQSNLIPIDLTVNAFLETLKDKDSVFLKEIHEKKDLEQQNNNKEEKSYFEE